MFSQIKEIFRWRQLLFALAFKDLKVKYRRASGGFGWMLAMPLMQTAVFIFIFLFVFKIEIENYPLFLLSGVLAWSFLRSSLDNAVDSVLNNANLIKKNYFPRQILPIATVIGNLTVFCFSLFVLLLFSLSFKISLIPALFWLPLIIFMQTVLIIGISLLLTLLNTIYRDARFISEALLMIWFYATPVVYSLEMAKEALSPGLFFLYKLNPMAGIICSYQNIFFYGRIPDMESVVVSFLAAGGFFILGVFFFCRYADIFADIL